MGWGGQGFAILSHTEWMAKTKKTQVIPGQITHTAVPETLDAGLSFRVSGICRYVRLIMEYAGIIEPIVRVLCPCGGTDLGLPLCDSLWCMVFAPGSV